MNRPDIKYKVICTMWGRSFPWTSMNLFECIPVDRLTTWNDFFVILFGPFSSSTCLLNLGMKNVVLVCQTCVVVGAKSIGWPFLLYLFKFLKISITLCRLTEWNDVPLWSSNGVHLIISSEFAIAFARGSQYVFSIKKVVCTVILSDRSAT